MNATTKYRLGRLLQAFAMPWNAFVAAFMYYTLLAVIALGGASPGVPVVATAYLAPVVMYVAALANRALRALGALAGEVMHPVRAARAHAGH
jgi:hypothetical protein